MLAWLREMTAKHTRPSLRDVTAYLDRVDRLRSESRRIVEDILAYDDGPEVDALIAADDESS